ncbi:MAG TPA: ABC transporter substrate-binding protein [Firmicutes bacterium]|nr:ABC transporter substrate-binding protein [Bacillota bacterium]HHT43340.1 ABC transporter substrate-binding protein [Bacillota bacterium]
MKRKIGLMLLVLVVACSSWVGFAFAQPIKIGVFEPMTGPSAAGGEMTVEGIELALEMKGEVLGREVQIIVVDNKSDKVEAANAVSRLIERDQVVAIIGSYGSSLSMAAGDIVNKAKVPTVGCSPTNPLVTLNNDYYFRVCFIDPFQGTVMANYAVNELGAKTAAVIQDVTQDYSVGLSKYFIDAFRKLTGDPNSIVEVSAYNTGDQDFTAQLTNVKNKQPDVIFAPGNYGESALLIRQARDLGIEVPFLGGDTWEAPEFLSIGGEAVEGAVFSTHFTAEAPVTPESDKFLAAYREKFGKEANAFAALGYDAYMLILDVIEKVGSADSQAIRDGLAQVEGFVGATGIITLDENGDAVKSAVINKVEDGKFVYLTTVEPF